VCFRNLRRLVRKSVEGLSKVGTDLGKVLVEILNVFADVGDPLVELDDM